MLAYTCILLCIQIHRISVYVYKFIKAIKCNNTKEDYSVCSWKTKLVLTHLSFNYTARRQGTSKETKKTNNYEFHEIESYSLGWKE